MCNLHFRSNLSIRFLDFSQIARHRNIFLHGYDMTEHDYLYSEYSAIIRLSLSHFFLGSHGRK